MDDPATANAEKSAEPASRQPPLERLDFYGAPDSVTAAAAAEQAKEHFVTPATQEDILAGKAVAEAIQARFSKYGARYPEMVGNISPREFGLGPEDLPRFFALIQSLSALLHANRFTIEIGTERGIAIVAAHPTVETKVEFHIWRDYHRRRDKRGRSLNAWVIRPTTEPHSIVGKTCGDCKSWKLEERLDRIVSQALGIVGALAILEPNARQRARQRHDAERAAWEAQKARQAAEEFQKRIMDAAELWRRSRDVRVMVADLTQRGYIVPKKIEAVASALEQRAITATRPVQSPFAATVPELRVHIDENDEIRMP